MRKFLFATLVAGLAFASCAKEDIVLQQAQVRTFDYVVSGTPMYKSVETDEVLTAISSFLPDSMKIYLSSQTKSKTYTGFTGKDIVLPSDNYRVIGSYFPEVVSGKLGGEEDYVTKQPRIDIDVNLQVTDDENQYTLIGMYKCFAIVVDAEETDKVFIKGSSGKEEEVEFSTFGTFKIAFVQGNYTTNALTLRIVPIDTKKHIESTYELISKTTSTKVQVENGKFYVFHPKTELKELKVVGLNLPAFARVDVN